MKRSQYNNHFINIHYLIMNVHCAYKPPRIYRTQLNTYKNINFILQSNCFVLRDINGNINFPFS